jgi:peptidoglycan glycosyltransferase
MKKIIFNLKLVLILFICFALALLGGLVIQQHRSRTRLAVAAGENVKSLSQRYSQAGTIYDVNGTVLAESDAGIRKYSENSEIAAAVLHTVGDYTQRIDNTIETRYQSVLLGTGRNPFHQLWLDVRGKGLYGDDIILTLDSGLCLQASHLLKDYNGSIVMINYRTGEVIASVSSPGTSPQSVIDYEGFTDTSLFNRALLGSYAPGSVFKLITAAAWINSENYDPNLKLVCTGKSTVHPDAADENGDGHGEVDLAEAIEKSCNVYFAEIGVRTGLEKLTETAEQFGITQPYSLDLLKGASGEIYSEPDDIMLSWLAIGQPSGVSRLSITPVELARLAGAIATGGDLYSSHIIDHL